LSAGRIGEHGDGHLLLDTPGAAVVLADHPDRRQGCRPHTELSEQIVDSDRKSRTAGVGGLSAFAQARKSLRFNHRRSELAEPTKVRASA
jgi:hypothetical protein